MRKAIHAIFCLAAVSIIFGSCAANVDRGGAVTAFAGAFVQTGRAIPELANLRIAYFEPVSGDADHAFVGSIQETDEPFTIVDFGPRDVLPHEIRYPSIFVVFSQPVVPLARLGEVMREDAGLFHIYPPLAGVFRWYGTRLLAFEPDAAIIPQQIYTVTVSDRITSLGGRRLEGERVFTFETERLSVLDWQVGAENTWVWNRNVHPEDGRYVRLTFSHPVNLDEIANWIEISANRETFGFTLEHLPEPEHPWFGWGANRRRILPEQRVLITITETLPLNTYVMVSLREGARSQPGWLGTLSPQAWSFHTLLPFRFENASARNFTQPRTPEPPTVPISLRFNQNVEPENIERFLSVDGFPALTAENARVFGNTVEIRGLPLQHETTYTVRISAGLSDLHGRPLGEARTVAVAVGAANSFVFVNNSGPRMLEAGFPARIIWEAQNPMSIRRLTRAAQSPYDIIPAGSPALVTMDLSALRPNAKNYFEEDFTPFLNAGGFGSVAMRWQSQIRNVWSPGQFWTQDWWLNVQVTNIGITTRYAYNMALVWATRLSDGAPIANAQVELMEGTRVVMTGATDAQGLAVFEFDPGDFTSSFTEPRVWGQDFSAGFRIRVTHGSGDMQDRAEFIPNNSHNIWRFNIPASANPFMVEQERPVTLIFTDRGLYQPGETVTFRIIDRSLVRGNFVSFHGSYEVAVSSDRHQAPAIATLSGVTTPSGGTYGSFTLPDNILPGQYRITYRRAIAGTQRMAETSIFFTVANFERLRFESALQFTDPIVHQGERLSASLSASWLAGGGLSGAPYTWHLTREPARFTPGGGAGAWRNWIFGPELTGGRSFVGQGEGSLDAGGRATITHEVSTEGIEGAVYSYRLEASVQDAARQEIARDASILVHPASFYIAARLDSGTLRSATDAGAGGFSAPNPSVHFVSAENPATVSWALVSPTGAAPEAGALQAAGQPPAELTFQLIRHEWLQARQTGVAGRINLVWERVETVVEERAVRLDPAAATGGHVAGVFNFTPDQSGMWEVRLQTQDSRQRVAATRFRFFVSGSGWVRWGADDVDMITLTTDRQSYAPGETAQILVRSPLERGRYLLTLEREGIISQQIIELDGSALVIDIPIEESFIPVVYVTLTSYTVRTGPPVGNYYEPDLDRPRGVFGVVPIFVDTESRSYQIEIEPNRSVFRPGEEAEVTIRVSRNGRPAPGAEVTFLAVDRGVVDLIDHRVPNPTDFFYNPRHFPLGVHGADSRSILIDPVLYNFADLQGGGDGEGMMTAAARAASAFETKGDDDEDVREDFRPTAVFEPFLLTGADGTVTVRFTLPDSLTTFRSTAVAVGLNTFGIREHDIRVSAPLTALPALPRRLRWRDTGTVSLILTNLESAAVEATVGLEIATLMNADTHARVGGGYTAISILEVDGASSQTVSIPPGESREVSFSVAALGAGQAQLAFVLRSPYVNERIIRTLEIERPILTESVTTIGSLGPGDSFIEEGLVLPSLVPEGTGSVMVSLSASRLASLREAVHFLVNNPFGGIEQRTARLLPIVAFGEHLEDFGLTTPTGAPWNPRRIVEEELAVLARYQLPDGSFPFWQGARNGDIFISLRVAHIVAMARARDMEVPAELDTRRLISFITAVSNNPNHWMQRDPFLMGYSLWVRTMHGEHIASHISAFLARGDELGISGWAFAGLAALEIGQRDIAVSARDNIRRFLRPGTRTVDLTDTFERRGNFWGFDTDRFALALMLFHALAPEDDMTTRLANSLIERQRGGVWGNTVSSFWAVLAFGTIAEAEAAEWRAGTGSLNAEVSIGGTNLFSANFANFADPPVSFNGAFADNPIGEIPRDVLLPLRIERAGPGRLYYTAILRYGIPVELAGARDEGLSVFVETFDAAGNQVTDGRLRAGATYTRRITVSTSRDRTHIALRSPVPSGAEIVDATFVTSPTVPPAPGVTEARSAEWDFWDRGFWQPAPVRFIMDNEVRFHWDFFPAGRQQMEFRFRAVMPGVYPTPPTSAEGMFEEEIFGRSAGELIRIE